MVCVRSLDLQYLCLHSPDNALHVVLQICAKKQALCPPFMSFVFHFYPLQKCTEKYLSQKHLWKTKSSYNVTSFSFNALIETVLTAFHIVSNVLKLI